MIRIFNIQISYQPAGRNDLSALSRTFAVFMYSHNPPISKAVFPSTDGLINTKTPKLSIIAHPIVIKKPKQKNP
jgi:hypothetical protein